MLESGDVEEAKKLLYTAPSLVERTFGGKIISPEQFAMNRVKILKEKGMRVFLCERVLFFFNLDGWVLK